MNGVDLVRGDSEVEQLTQVWRNGVTPEQIFAGLVSTWECHDTLSAHPEHRSAAKSRGYGRGEGGAQGRTGNKSTLWAGLFFYFLHIPYQETQNRCTHTPHTRYMHFHIYLRCCGQAAARESRNLR